MFQLLDKLQRLPSTAGMQLITQMESAEGLLNLRQVCQTLSEGLRGSIQGGQLAAVIFGSDDFCASIGELYQ